MVFVHAEVFCHMGGDLLSVPGQHDQPSDPRIPQRADRLFHIRLFQIRDHNMPRIGAVHGHVDDGSDAAAFLIVQSQAAHQLVVSGGNSVSVYRSDHAFSADFFDVGDEASVCFLAVRPLQALADRVRGRTFYQCRELQQFFVLHRTVMDAADFKHALRQGPGLVEYHRLHP